MKPTDLYRIYDQFDRLLYVGISLNAGVRLATHRNEKSWWGDVKRVEVQHFLSREDAKRAETLAIHTENPVYNVQEDLRDGERRYREQTFWGLLCYLDPRLEKIERLVLDLPDLTEADLDVMLTATLGWRRHGIPEFTAPEEPTLLMDSLEGFLDDLEDKYDEGASLIPKEELLSSQHALDFARSYLIVLAGRRAT